MLYSLFIYISVVSGVVVSVLLPIMREVLYKSLNDQPSTYDIWDIIKDFSILSIFSLLVAIVVVASLGDKITNWQTGFIAGYTADSTLQKIADPTSERFRTFLRRFSIPHHVSKVKS